MIEPIEKTKPSLSRIFSSASIGFTIFTIFSGLILGLVNPKDKSVFKYALYTSLFGTAAGGIFGSVIGSKPNHLQQSNQQNNDDKNIWQDWRNFIVVRKVKESEEITSFYLEPQDKDQIPNFQPGQFLTIKLDIPGQSKPVIRTYSLSDYTEPCKYYRLSIKRELAPPELNVMAGIASNFMHDFIHEGSLIPAKPPSGRFVLDPHKTLPAVLISNGVGITPMISMAKAITCLNSSREVHFLHGARNSDYHAFREEVLGLADKNSNIKVHFCYSRPDVNDKGKYNTQGYIDATLIQELTTEKAEFFLCGSPSFMQSLRDGLQAWGVPVNRIFFESFSKPVGVSSSRQTSITTEGESVTTAEIVFAKSAKTLTWKQGDGSILEFAENNGINPPYSCRAGICGTCMCQISEGEVIYQEEPTAAVDEDSVLICISQPRTQRIVIDI
jgi:uncharacterized protein